MKKTAKLLLLAVAVLGFNADAAKTVVTPVQKVVELLNGMLEKGKQEKHAEELQFTTYKQFCQDTTADKTTAIAEASDKIELLAATIEKKDVEANRLAKEIQGHEEDISSWTADTNAANAQRDEEKATFDKTLQDLTESIDALNGAITVLKEQNYNRKQASSLVQIEALTKLPTIPSDTKNALSLFLQDNDVAPAGPEAHGYEFQSNGVIDMLAKLLDKFMAQRTKLETEEANQLNAFNLLVQDLKGQISVGNDDIDDKTTQRHAAKEASAQASADKNDTENLKASDEEYKKNLVTTCKKKATDFAARQKLRGEEMVAIKKATEIIAGNQVATSANRHLPAASLAQLRATANGVNQADAAKFLSARATALNSKVLSALATTASNDPFVKVRQLIQDLINRMKEEAAEEADHKAFCDTELKKNTITRERKTAEVDALTAKMDGHEAKINQLTLDLEDHNKELAKTEAAIKEAQDLRKSEHEENTMTIDDCQVAQKAVSQAMAVLRDFYEKAGQATSLIQQQPEAPEIFDSPYQGMTSEKGGVVGLLEVIETDFANLEAETTAAEAEALAKFNDFMTESKMTKAELETNIEHKTGKKLDHNQKLAEAKEDYEGTKESLAKAVAYFDELKPTCLDASVSYSSRVADREAEIQSCEEALRILNGEDIA